MKKYFLKILAMILAVCCLVSMVGTIPTMAASKQDVPKTKDLFAVGENIQIKKAEQGVRIAHTRATQGWERVHTNELYTTTGDGIQIEIEDIASADLDYSMAVMFGNDQGKWYDGPGYMIIYGKSGYFSVITTDGKVINPNESTVLVSETREELSDTLAIHIKLTGSKYEITVNGKSYSVKAGHLTDEEDVYLAFGVMGDGSIKGLNYNKSFETGAVSYTIAKLGNQMVGADYEPIGDVVSPSAVGMSVTTHLELRESEEGIQVAFPTDTEGWERARFTSAFPVNEEGLHVALTNIYSEDSDYSIAVMLGGAGNSWYDGPGYILIYGKSGNFSIIGTDGVTINPNESEVLVSEKREVLGEDLTIDILPNDDQYMITVNGKSYTIPTVNLDNPEEVHLIFGVMGDGNIKTLNYNKSFKKAAVSFVIAKETYTLSVASARTLKPFAAYTAFMTGYKGGTFKPEKNLTRGEAVVSMAKLLIDETDIQDVYTSDFTDIKSKDENYDFYAYMERSGFLPDFGEELKPKQAITRGEFVDLLLDDTDVAEGSMIADVDAEDELYGKICYAIEKGIVALDSEQKFNPDEKVTRGEAAKMFCVYLGKEAISNPKNEFKDVTEKTDYAEYILLAANEGEYHKETFKVTTDGDETIQTCIDKAIALSETKDALVTIELADGVYQLDEPIQIYDTASREYELMIVIQNAKDASPIISGNADFQASEFEKVDGQEYYSYQLPESSKVEGNWPKFRDLYLNGERLQLARSEDYIFEKTLKDMEKTDDTITSYSNWFYVDKTIFENIDNESVEPLEICLNVEWNLKRFRIANLYGEEAETGLMQLSVKDEEWHGYLKYEGNKRDFTSWSYWFENHLSLLDEPGEFYYDDTNGVIYFYPYTDTDMSKSTVSYPMVEKLFDMKNVSGITFEGLTFTGTTSNFATEHGFNCGLGNTHAWDDNLEQKSEDKFFQDGEENPLEGWESEHIQAAAIYGEYSKHVLIRNCTFDQLGTNGIYLNGGTNGIVVKESSFTNLAMSAAVFGKQNQLWNPEEGQSNLLIDNNYIYNIGTDYMASPGIAVARVKNIAVTHNTFLHTPYSGLMMGWINLPSASFTIYNAEVAYNHCEDNLYALNDGAGLYFCGANGMTTEAGVYNRIHDNYIKSTGYTGTYNGIYLDMNASNHSVYHNVIEGYDTAHGPIFNQDHFAEQYSYNNILTNNYTTVRSITSTADPERNIQLIDNQQFATAAELPEEALSIIEGAGQKEDDSSSVPEMDTVIDLKVEEPHITINKLGSSEKDSVIFTITNNGEDAASYSVIKTSDNDESIKVHVSTESLELKAGESGTIEVSFESGETSKKGELFNFAVVKGNGWKREYRRVIEVDVSNAYATADMSAAGLQWVIIIGVLAVIAAGSVIAVVVIKRKKQNRAEEI